MTPDDSHLVKACIDGDSAARKELYDRFAPVMFGVCLRYARCREDAQDALHDGFIKVFTSLHKLRNTESLGAWIHSIMVFTSINSLRHSFESIDNDDHYVEIPDNSHSDNDILESMDCEDIVCAIRQLPPRYQLVFNLVEIDGFSYNEVASKLSIDPSTVRSNLHRAKRILQSKLSYRRK